VVISGIKLILGFPVPIIFALMLNELSNLRFKRIVQTISYLPHFISWVVVLTILNQFLAMDGLINQSRRAAGLDAIFYLNRQSFFYPMVYFTSVWKNMGYSAIIYVAALATVDPALYEAAIVDGANRFRRIWHISLPSILPTIMILFILRFAQILRAGWDQIYLLRMPGNIARSQIIDTYVIEIGLEGGQFGNATAVALFQSVIGLIMVLIVNRIAKKISDVGLF
jgi:putative aldouronate transport system permease protein